MDVAPIVKYRTLAIAKSMTPIDTGNLRHNAVHLRKRMRSSWTIAYDSRDAFYIEYVEEGTKNQDAQKFVARTSLYLASYLQRYFDGKPTSKWYGKRLKEALSTAQSTDERKIRHEVSLARSK